MPWKIRHMSRQIPVDASVRIQGLCLKDVSGDADRDKPSRDMISHVGLLIYSAHLGVTVSCLSKRPM